MQATREQERKWQDSILPPVQVFVEFYDDEVVDIQASNLAGARVTKSKLLIKKKVKGDRFSLLTAEAKESDVRQYPNEYNQYLRSKNDNQESGYQASNQESGYQASSNSGRGSQVTAASGRINRSESGIKKINNWSGNQGQSSIRRVRTGRGKIRSGESRQVHHNQSPCGDYQINFGSFAL